MREACIILPFVAKGILGEFGIKELSRGRLYSSGNGDSCTVINTRMGGVFTGDAVLYLSETPCREIYFLGTCGLLQIIPGLNIGSIVSPSHCYAQESFTSLLLEPTVSGILTTPDSILLRSLINYSGVENIKEVICISAGSLKIQPDKIGEWKEKGIQAVDLESAAFFSAAGYMGLSAAALMVVSDIIEVSPWYRDHGWEYVSGSSQRAARILCEFITKKQRD